MGDSQHELGLLDSRHLPELGGGSPASGPGGAVVHWHVDDVPAILDLMMLLGATAHHPPRDVGEGSIGASVVDPLGNLLGVRYDPHHLDRLATRR